MAAQVEFVAFGVTAEIVVIVENEDAAVRVGLCTVEVRGGKAAQARADDDQVVFLAGVRGRGRWFTVAQRMGVLEGTGVTAAQAGEERGVVAKGVLSGGRQLGGARGGSEQGAGGSRGGSYGDAVQEVAPRDGLIHPEETVARAILFFLRHWSPVQWNGTANYRSLGGTCQCPKTVYNTSHWLHIQVKHVGPYPPSNPDLEAHSRRHCGKRDAAHSCGNRAHAGLQITECRRGTLARLAAQGRHRSHPRRFPRHPTQGHSA